MQSAVQLVRMPRTREGQRMAAIRLVVFDVGETLVDESRMWGEWADWLGVTRLTFFAALGAVIAARQHHRQAFELVRPGLDLRREREARQSRGGITRIERRDLYPDAVPALTRLRGAGLLIGIAGNQPEEAEEEIRALGLAVDFVASSASWGVAKPDPAFFNRIVSETRVAPSQIAYVGDRLDNDVLPAIAAGMTGVFLRRGPWGVIHATWPEAARADLRLDGLEELPEALPAFQIERTRNAESDCMSRGARRLVSRRSALAGLAAAGGYGSVLAEQVSDSSWGENGGGPVFSSSGPNAERYGAAEGYPIADRSLAIQPGEPHELKYRVGAYSHFDEIYPTRRIKRSAAPWIFKRSPADIRYYFHGSRSSLAEYLARNPVTGLLIARDDWILFEHYQYGRTDRDRLMSRSMAKSITAMLIGIAIGESAIKSVDETAETYVPGFKDTEYGKTPIRGPAAYVLRCRIRRNQRRSTRPQSPVGRHGAGPGADKGHDQ
jgi:FMN phosphatase YigB (HAD superfamily)